MLNYLILNYSKVFIIKIHNFILYMDFWVCAKVSNFIFIKMDNNLSQHHFSKIHRDSFKCLIVHMCTLILGFSWLFPLSFFCTTITNASLLSSLQYFSISDSKSHHSNFFQNSHGKTWEFYLPDENYLSDKSNSIQ